MTHRVPPGRRSGCVRIPASKSQAHRLLILAALGKHPCKIICDGISADISATVDCLRALGAEIEISGETIQVSPILSTPSGLRILPCGESGSTLRFLLPVIGALGAEAAFHMEGRLPQRPLAPLDEELTRHGMNLRRDGTALFCKGQLSPGAYDLPGNVSSQYISGLLLALPHLQGDSTLKVTGSVESAGYISMTEDALRLAGINFAKEDWSYRIRGQQEPVFPKALRVEGDWSNAAFFLAAGALSASGISVQGLNPASSQGDRAVLEILRAFGAQISKQEKTVHVCGCHLHGVEIDAAPIPDLIPVLSVVAAEAEGETRILNASRLRLKESDRLSATAALLRTLGAEVAEYEDALVIHGGLKLRGGTVDSFGDHRIAMSAAVAACLCDEEVCVAGSECVKKSYPRFWEDWEGLTI